MRIAFVHHFIRAIIASSIMLFAGWVIYADAGKEKSSLPKTCLTAKDFLAYSTAPLKPGEVDGLIDAVISKAGIKQAPLTTDEQFFRRVSVDLTGKLPTPAMLAAFLADKKENKRSRLIDQLLDSDDFARHWARHFREVITSKVVEPTALPFAKNFEDWLTTEFRAGTGWDKITRDILTASGEIRYDEPGKNGQAFFLASRKGNDAVTDLTGETARIFLGIQMQCAQCHDHPSDIWTRQQFHELAAFYARTKQKQLKTDDKKKAGVAIVSAPQAEYTMPSPDGAAPPKAKGALKGGLKKGLALAPTAFVSPKFIDGTAPKKGLSDLARRAALADDIVSKKNPWFAAAFANRIWGQMMGQAFYMPLDDLGPTKEAVMPEVLARVSGSFRGDDYDVKQLFRDIANTKTYQLQIRPGDSPDEHLLFTAHNLTRMNGETLWDALNGAIGPNIDKKGANKAGIAKAPANAGFAAKKGLQKQFLDEFAYDPSTKPEELEGSVSQALLLMNNPSINQKVQAKAGNVLASVLQTSANDDQALTQIYMRTLARRPTSQELARCKSYIQQTARRPEAYEDILWALINSTEFQSNR